MPSNGTKHSLAIFPEDVLFPGLFFLLFSFLQSMAHDGILVPITHDDEVPSCLCCPFRSSRLLRLVASTINGSICRSSFKRSAEQSGFRTICSNELSATTFRVCSFFSLRNLFRTPLDFVEHSPTLLFRLPFILTFFLPRSLTLLIF
uniref:EDM2 n=1 Tax=Arundo donax TaxID=35708 RepID=A0A0A9DGB6_ARUDO